MRQTLDTWENILRNLAEEGEEVEVIYLDSTDEWCLCFDCEMFEDDFNSEEEARIRLDEVVSLLEQ